MVTVADPGFPWRHEPSGGGGGMNTRICQILPKNCMKLKEFGRPGGGGNILGEFTLLDKNYEKTGINSI